MSDREYMSVIRECEYVYMSTCMCMSLYARIIHLVARRGEVCLAVVSVLPPPCPPGHEARQRLVPQVHHRSGVLGVCMVCI